MKNNNAKQVRSSQDYSERMREIVEIETLAIEMIEAILEEADIDSDIVSDIKVYGSYSKLLETDDSDIDILVEYSGDYREDTLFDILNDENNHCTYDNRRIDFNPIHPKRSGTIDEYLKHLQWVQKVTLQQKPQSF